MTWLEKVLPTKDDVLESHEKRVYNFTGTTHLFGPASRCYPMSVCGHATIPETEGRESEAICGQCIQAALARMAKMPDEEFDSLEPFGHVGHLGTGLVHVVGADAASTVCKARIRAGERFRRIPESALGDSDRRCKRCLEWRAAAEQRSSRLTGNLARVGTLAQVEGELLTGLPISGQVVYVGSGGSAGRHYVKIGGDCPRLAYIYEFTAMK